MAAPRTLDETDLDIGESTLVFTAQDLGAVELVRWHARRRGRRARA